MSLPTNMELHKAAAEGDLPTLRELIKSQGANTVDEYGNTALFHAVWNAQLSAVNLFLETLTPAEVMFQNKDGNTPLHFAVARGESHIPVIEALMAFGCDDTVQNAQDESAQDIVKKKAAVFAKFPHVKKMFGVTGNNNISSTFMNKIRRKASPSTTDRGVSIDGRSRSSTATGGGIQEEEELLLLKAESHLSAKRIEGLLDLMTEQVDETENSGANQKQQQSMSGILRASHLAPIFAFMGLNLSKLELKEVLRLMDCNGDGIVDKQDLVALLSQPMPLEEQTEWSVDVPFACFDKDGDGALDVHDLKESGQALGKLSYINSEREALQVLHFCMLNAELTNDEKNGLGAPSSQTSAAFAAAHNQRGRRTSVAAGVEINSNVPKMDKETFAAIATGTFKMGAAFRLSESRRKVSHYGSGTVPVVGGPHESKEGSKFIRKKSTSRSNSVESSPQNAGEGEDGGGGRGQSHSSGEHSNNNHGANLHESNSIVEDVILEEQEEEGGGEDGEEQENILEEGDEGDQDF